MQRESKSLVPTWVLLHLTGAKVSDSSMGVFLLIFFYKEGPRDSDAGSVPAWLLREQKAQPTLLFAEAFCKDSHRKVSSRLCA